VPLIYLRTTLRRDYEWASDVELLRFRDPVRDNPVLTNGVIALNDDARKKEDHESFILHRAGAGRNGSF